MKRIEVKEHLDRRYLGALCFVDCATQGVLRRSFKIETRGLSFFVNPSYLHVIAAADGLEAHTQSFSAPPDQPAVCSKYFDLTITDPLQKYLPRIKRIELPLNPDPAAADNLFEPIRISLFPASCAPLNPNWSIIRTSVFQFGGDDEGQPLGGALLRVVRSEDGKLVACGLTDQRGEALIVVPGIPFSNFVTDENQPGNDDEPDHDDWMASGAVVEKETSARLEVLASGGFSWPVDPDVLEKNRNECLCMVTDDKDGGLAEFLNLKLKTGRTRVISLFVRTPEDT